MATGFRQEKNKKSQPERLKLISESSTTGKGGQILLQFKTKYPRPKLKFSYYMSQEALTFYICCSFHTAGGCRVLLRSSEATCSVHSAPEDLKNRTGSACSLPLSISLSHPTSKRRLSLCQHVGEWSPTSLNINWSQPKEQPSFERREWPQADFQMTCWHWFSEESWKPSAGGRIIFTLQGEVSDLGCIPALSIFHSQGEGERVCPRQCCPL